MFLKFKKMHNKDFPMLNKDIVYNIYHKKILYIFTI